MDDNSTTVRLEPKSPAEHERFLALACSTGALTTNAEIEQIKFDPRWRTKYTRFRGCDFCAECNQILTTRTCTECGLPLPQSLPTLLDLAPAPSELRACLQSLATELLQTQIHPKIVLAILHFYNQTVRLSLQFEDVDMIFSEAAAREVLRRKGA